MKKAKGELVLFLLLLSIFPLFVSKVNSQRTSVQFSPLQEIINGASEGEVIKVTSGTYYGLLKINKTLTLEGTNVVIDANYSQVGIIISAQRVKLKSFTVRNVVRFGNGSIPQEISELQAYPEMEGAGIYVYNAGAVVISNVTVEDVYAGIALGQILYAQIVNSTILRTSWGVMIHGGASISISKSLITLNRGGIRLWGYTSSNTIENCTISNNLWGIVSGPNPYDNSFHFNNFINNTNQVYIHPDGDVIANWYYNYWSDYNGTDLNFDGVGDTPYIINGLNQDLFPLMKDPLLLESPEKTYGGARSAFAKPTLD